MNAPRIPDETDIVRRRLARLAWLLDNSIPLFGGRYRIGIDAILGLVPGLGDLVGVIFSSYIVREAALLGAPPSVLGHMLVNVVVEGVVGLIPFAGDVFDAVWKANQRNVDLLEAHIRNPRHTARKSRWLIAGLTAALVAFIVLIAAIATLTIRVIAAAFSG